MDDKFKKARIKKTRIGFLYSIAGVTFPFLLSLFAIAITRKYDYIIRFLDNGEFLLFSVGLLASTFYIFRDPENAKAAEHSAVKGDETVSHIVSLMLLVSSAIYAMLLTVTITDFAFPIDVWFVRIASLILFIFSCYANFRSINIDFLKVYPIIDVQQRSADAVNDMLDEF